MVLPLSIIAQDFNLIDFNCHDFKTQACVPTELPVTKNVSFLKIFPSSANVILNIDTDLTGKMIIIDVNGKIWLENFINKNSINVSDLPQGIYILRINNLSAKFVKIE
jgi:hypothetical protein